MATIKEIFDRQFDGVKIDRALCARVIEFSNRFMTRNQDHNEFFGGVFIGVNTVRFLDSDRDHWYNDVLTIDGHALAEDFKRNASAVNHDFNVMGNVFNYTGIYLCYRLHKTTGIPQSLRNQAMVHAIMVQHYSYLTSLFYRRFERYAASREIMQATYNSLSKRYDIRRVESWRELIEERGEEIVFKNPLYRQAVQQFAPDNKIISLVTTTQGRLRELINAYYRAYVETLRRGDRVKTEGTNMVTADGETILRDRIRGYSTYQHYIRRVAQDDRDFYRAELVTVVTNIVKNAPPQILEKVLHEIPKKIATNKYLEDMITDTVVYLFDYLSKQRTVLRQNTMPTIVSKLKTVLTASGSRDKTVLDIRKAGDKLVTSVHPTRVPTVVTSVRTAVLLYVVLRTITKDYYS